MQRQFTATTYVIEEGKVLLLYHPKFQKWLPPGGHIEPNETPPECARREVLEETGFEIAFLQDDPLLIDRPNAVSIERPFLCLLENVPAFGETPAHQHIDFIYLARPIASHPRQEDHPIRWFTLEQVKQLRSDEEIFQDIQQVIDKILQCEEEKVKAREEKKWERKREKKESRDSRDKVP